MNEFEMEEALEICRSIRDKLTLDTDLPLKSRWAEKDAMAQIINFVSRKLEKSE